MAGSRGLSRQSNGGASPKIGPDREQNGDANPTAVGGGSCRRPLGSPRPGSRADAVIGPRGTPHFQRPGFKVSAPPGDKENRV